MLVFESLDVPGNSTYCQDARTCYFLQPKKATEHFGNLTTRTPTFQYRKITFISQHLYNCLLVDCVAPLYFVLQSFRRQTKIIINFIIHLLCTVHDIPPSQLRTSHIPSSSGTKIKKSCLICIHKVSLFPSHTILRHPCE